MWRRYSREGASQSLPRISHKLEKKGRKDIDEDAVEGEGVPGVGLRIPHRHGDPAPEVLDEPARLRGRSGLRGGATARGLARQDEGEHAVVQLGAHDEQLAHLRSELKK